MTSIEADGWELESAVERQRQNPSFGLPPEAERRNVPVGETVKLLFVIPAEVDDDGDLVYQVERMWVEVSSRTDDGYEGVLLNRPATPNDVLDKGAVVHFDADHVIDIYKAPLFRRLTRVFRRT